MPKFAFSLRRWLAPTPRSRSVRRAAVLSAVGATLRVEPLEARDVPAGDGLSAVYFDSATDVEAQSMVGATTSTVVANVNYNWGSGKPAGTPAAFGADTFAARFAGSVEAPTTGTYTFRTRSDDGVRLWVDDRLVINNWTPHSPTDNDSPAVQLQAGQRYRIVLEYYERNGGAEIRLQWKKPGDAGFAAIPQANLYSDRKINPAIAWDSNGQPIAYNFLNVKAYGAVGDGKTDDWWAIQRAISDAGRKLNSAPDGPIEREVVYLPAGTYLVSRPLEWRKYNSDQTPGIWEARRQLQGEQRDNVIIKLMDNAPAGNGNDFDQAPNINEAGTNGLPVRRNAVIYTASNQSGGTTTSNYGGGNTAFRNGLFDLTVNTGRDNPGAVGIDFAVSNTGAIRDVRVTSGAATSGGVTGTALGYAGIHLSRNDNGPGLIQDVAVDGFQHGIRHKADNVFSALTLEDIRLSNQTTAGIVTSRGSLSIRGLRSEQASSAVYGIVVNDFNSHLTLIDARLSNSGAAGGTALRSLDSAAVLARNVTAPGYATTIDVSGTANDRTGAVSEFSSAVFQGAGARTATLNLPVKETPDFYSTNPNDWHYVGDPTGGNDTTMIQNALNFAAANNKPIVYFKSAGIYQLNRTITIPAGVRLIEAYSARFYTTRNDIVLSSNPDFTKDTTGASNGLPFPVVFKVIAGTDPNAPVIFRGLVSETNYWIHSTNGAYANNIAGLIDVYHNSPRPVVIRDAEFLGYRNGTNSGDLFLEDAYYDDITLGAGKKMFARQWDTETRTNVNDGGTMWILGIKTEGNRTILRTQNGGQTELLGGFLLNNHPTTSSPAAFEVNDSTASFSFQTRGRSDLNPSNYTVYVRVKKNGVIVDELTRSEVPDRAAGGDNIALYVTD